MVFSLGFGIFTQQLVAYDTMVPVREKSALSPGNVPWIQRWDYYLGSPASNSMFMQRTSVLPMLILL